jgi:MarR family transcriptional regulator, organic hydroperoxide resistance regulator
MCQLPQLRNNSTTLTNSQKLRTWLGVVRTYQMCSDQITSAIEPLGLNLSQFDVLLCLLNTGPQNQQQLTVHSFVVKSHMSTIIKTMEKNLWINRADDPNDKRNKIVSLSKKGSAMAQKCAVIQLEIMNRMFNPLSKQQIEETETIMLLIKDALAR